MRAAEARVAKVEALREKLAGKLADPALYENGRARDMSALQRQYAEAEAALERAEALWMRAAPNGSRPRVARACRARSPAGPT